MANTDGDDDEIYYNYSRVQIFVICYFNPRITIRFIPHQNHNGCYIIKKLPPPPPLPLSL